MGSYMEIFVARVLGENLSFWLKNHQYWELFLVYAITLVNMDRFEYVLHVACNYHYLGWVLTWKYLKQGFWGGNLSFWLKNHQYWELFLVYVITLVNMDRFEYVLHVACNYHYLGWVLTWKYLKQGLLGKISVFGWKITNIENCVLFTR